MANSVPELTQISTLLSNIAQNYDELSRNWYDIFYNPVPMDVEVKFFDTDGILFTTKLPNRAKDFKLILNGEGNPENVISAGKGTIYQDTLNGKIYLKNSVSGTTGVSKDGWIELITISSIYTIGTESPIGKKIGKKGDLYVEIGVTSEGKDKAILYINISDNDEGSSEAWVKVSGDGGSAIEEYKYVHTTDNEEINGSKTFLQDVIIKRSKQAFTVYESTSNNAKLQVGISNTADKGIYDVDKDKWLIKVSSSKNNLVTDCTKPSASDNSNSVVTTAWIRTATGNTTLNAATATKATSDSSGNNIVNTYQKKLTAGKGITISGNTISSSSGISISYNSATETLVFTM